MENRLPLPLSIITESEVIRVCPIILLCFIARGAAMLKLTTPIKRKQKSLGRGTQNPFSAMSPTMGSLNISP